MVANSSSVLDKIVSLARAGVYFCEGYTGRILIASCFNLDYLPLDKHIKEAYVLGPEEGKLLLFIDNCNNFVIFDLQLSIYITAKGSNINNAVMYKRDEIYKSDLVGISQTPIAGVVRIAVFDIDNCIS